MIDGHPLVRLGVREALGEGFQVHESANRTEGLDLIRDVGSIDVAIVDMRPCLPANGHAEPTGREAIRALHQAEPGMGIVAHGEVARALYRQRRPTGGGHRLCGPHRAPR